MSTHSDSKIHYVEFFVVDVVVVTVLFLAALAHWKIIICAVGRRNGMNMSEFVYVCLFLQLYRTQKLEYEESKLQLCTHVYVHTRTHNTPIAAIDGIFEC